MSRYLNGAFVRFTENDKVFVDVEFYGGEKYTGAELHRLFPISGRNKYISVLDSDGNEIGIIRDVNDLAGESKEVVERVLDNFYMIPKITRFIKMTEKFKIWMWTAETDRGVFTFEIRNHLTALKPLYDGRILIKDADDNRYEIPDVNKLDSRSRKMILPDI